MIPKVKQIISEQVDPLINEYAPNYILKKKRGRKVDYYMFNEAKFLITDNIIVSLIKNSNRARKFIELEKYISDLLKITNYLSFFNNGKLNTEKVNLFVTDNISPAEFKLTKDEIKNRFVLELYQIKEISSYKNRKAIELMSIKHDYSKEVFSHVELAELNSFKDYKYSDDEFYYVFSNNAILKSKYFVIRKYSIILTDYDTNFHFPDLEDDYEAIKVNDLPFNYNDSQPRYFYPVLPNGAVIPLTDKKYQYGSLNIAPYQQIELSTASTHNAYYYRKATYYYTYNIETLIEYLYLYVNDIKTNKVIMSYIKELNPLLTEYLLGNKSFNDLLIKIEKNKKYKDCVDVLKSYSLNLYYIQRLFYKDKNELIDNFSKIITDKDAITEFENDIIIYRDLDLYNNPIPLFYKIENNKQVFVDDIEIKDGLFPTNFIVAKGKNKNNKVITIAIDDIKENGIDSILNNNIDYPIFKGTYDIRTPYNIYFPPTKNNIVKKGLICSNGEVNYSFLKRTRILYIPMYYFDSNGTRIKIDQANFKLIEGRELSNLPILAYSYLLTPLTENDKLIYLKQKHDVA